MPDSRSADTSSFCEIAGCTSPAVSEVWSVDENHHLQVCWKHSADDAGTAPAES